MPPQLTRPSFMASLGLYTILVLLQPAYASDPQLYRVKVSTDLTQLDISTCLHETTFTRLLAQNRVARHYLLHAELRRKEQVIPLHVNNLSSTAEIPLAASRKGDCIHYRVETRHTAWRNWGENIRKWEQVMLDPKDWLWKPESINTNPPIQVEFELPGGMQASAPWSLVSRSQSTVKYRIKPRLDDWDGRVALGKFYVEDITTGDSVIHLAVLNHQPSLDMQKYKQWINANINALKHAYGRMPVPELQFLLVPIGHDREAVPWGQLMRGGEDAVHLYIDPFRPLEEFMQDWVLVHELSHLFHPRMAGKDIWFSEGLASYYQNVLRARAGMLSAEQAWEKLHAGFERGIRGTPKNRSLTDVSETMMRDRTFMRVYWSGAAFSLLADIELRKLSGGEQGLDSVLEKFQRCCLPANRTWTGIELMERLDTLSATSVFSSLYEKHSNSERFPDLVNAYKHLGLKKSGDELVVLKDKPFPLRESIMQPR